MPEESASTEYVQGYHRDFFRTLEMGQGAKAWGAPEGLPPAQVRSRQRQAREVLDFLQGDGDVSDTSFCDLSAGAGYCTFEAARKYRLVFHCELSVDSLIYAPERRNKTASKILSLYARTIFSRRFGAASIVSPALTRSFAGHGTRQDCSGASNAF